MRAPTEQEMKDRYVPLEEKEAGYSPDPAYPSVRDLLDYMDEHGIPRSAVVEYHDCGSHMIALSWGGMADA